MRLTRKHLSSPTLIPDDCREMPRLSSCFCLSCAKKIQREKLFSIFFCIWWMVLWNMNYRTSRHKQNDSPDKTVQIIDAVTCAISSVFLSFSSQVTVISCISFSDSSSLSFSSGAFIDCRGTWLLTCCFWHFATSYYENDKKVCTSACVSWSRSFSTSSRSSRMILALGSSLTTAWLTMLFARSA